MRQCAAQSSRRRGAEAHDLFVATQAVAESRRLTELQDDQAMAFHQLGARMRAATLSMRRRELLQNH